MAPSVVGPKETMALNRSAIVSSGFHELRNEGGTQYETLRVSSGSCRAARYVFLGVRVVGRFVCEAMPCPGGAA